MPKNLSSFLDEISEIPGELARVSRPIKAHAFEATAIMEKMDKEEDLRAVLVENPENLFDKPAGIPLVSNVFGTRERIARAIAHPIDDLKLGLSLEMTRRDRGKHCANPW